MLHSAVNLTPLSPTLGIRNLKLYRKLGLHSSTSVHCCSCAVSMSSDDLATSTRVFVSGLPPSFTSDHLRKHFSQKADVTDAHVIADRRIGFLGFADHDRAQNAVKYFNKSFIRMSKISVALARPVDVNRDANGQAAPLSQKQEKLHKLNQVRETRKRKREPKDDGEQQRQSLVNPTPEEDQFAPSPRQKVPGEDTFEGFGSDNEEQSMQNEEAGLNKSLSDSDWLRGKTNRTLDLQDPDAEKLEARPTQQLPSPVSPRQSPQPPVKTTDGAMEVELNPKDPVVVPNGRLFVRNLAFSVSEQDLESLFDAFGRLEEVRRLFQYSMPSFRDDFLIGTSYASHMIRTGSQFFSRCFATLSNPSTSLLPA